LEGDDGREDREGRSQEADGLRIRASRDVRVEPLGMVLSPMSTELECSRFVSLIRAVDVW